MDRLDHADRGAVAQASLEAIEEASGWINPFTIPRHNQGFEFEADAEPGRILRKVGPGDGARSMVRFAFAWLRAIPMTRSREATIPRGIGPFRNESTPSADDDRAAADWRQPTIFLLPEIDGSRHRERPWPPVEMPLRFLSPSSEFIRVEARYSCEECGPNTHPPAGNAGVRRGQVEHRSSRLSKWVSIAWP